MENTVPPGTQACTGNARADIPDAAKECNSGGTTRHAGVLLQCVSGTQCIRRVVTYYRSEAVKPSP